MRVAALLIAALVLAGCGSSHRPAKAKPAAVPAYPGATGERSSANSVFATTDWKLPPGTRPSTVYDWYTAKLQALGWRVTQRNETGLHAERRGKRVDIGVRGRTLEVISQ